MKESGSSHVTVHPEQRQLAVLAEQLAPELWQAVSEVALMELHSVVQQVAALEA